MNRRTLIRQALLLTGATVLLPACKGGNDPSASSWDSLSVTQDQQKILAHFCEVLLPKGLLPGAKELGTDQFVLRMINDCRSPDEQRSFEQQLAAFEKWSMEETGKDFFTLDNSQANELLHNIERQGTGSDNEVQLFYKTARTLALQHYLNSEAYLSKVAGYNIIPSKYQGCSAA